jgi:2-dehydropantoate 2-reductase
MRETAIIGAGALGAIYGSMLHERYPGFVCFIADGRRYDSMKNRGVKVNGKKYEVPVVKPADSRPADLIIVAVKYHDLDQAMVDMKKSVGKESVILSVMNGIDSEERLGAVFGKKKVIYGLTLGIDAVREGDSVTYDNLGRILLGEAKNIEISERVRRTSELLTAAGIINETPVDMIRNIWFKFMINVGANQVSAVMGATYGALRASKEAMEMTEAAMREVIAVARALHINLTPDDIPEWRKVLATLGENGKTSMLQDVEAGRKTEVEMLSGMLIQLGERLGVPTPVNHRLFNEIRQIESGGGT